VEEAVGRSVSAGAGWVSCRPSVDVAIMGKGVEVASGLESFVGLRIMVAEGVRSWVS
jgi:hypothetical protein